MLIYKTCLYYTHYVSFVIWRQPIRHSRQIVDKNKRQGQAFSKKSRDSAHWGPEAVKAEFGIEAI